MRAAFSGRGLEGHYEPAGAQQDVRSQMLGVNFSILRRRAPRCDKGGQRSQYKRKKSSRAGRALGAFWMQASVRLPPTISLTPFERNEHTEEEA